VGKVEEAVRSAVMRVVSHELRGSVVPLAREVRELKRVVSSLARSVAQLEKMAAQQARAAQQELSRLEAPEEEVEAARLSPRLVRSLRRRLRLTQGELAALLGVSTNSVNAWEAGRSAPRGANRASLVALRKVGRREVKRILAEKVAAAARTAPVARKPRRRRAKVASKK